jgi:hypothetical protein
MDYFEKGEDIYRSVQLTIGGVAADTDDFVTIEVKIFDWKTKLLASYSTATATVTREAPSTDGYISFIVPSLTNFDSRIGKYFYQVTTWEYDADYPDGLRTRKFVGQCYGLKYAKLSTNIRSLLCDEYRTVYDAFETKPSNADALIQNTLLCGLVDAGIYDKCELIDIFSAHNQVDSLINWKSPGTFDPEEVVSPEWEQYAGFRGNPADGSAIKLNFTPDTDATLMSQNDACAIIGVGEHVAINFADFGSGDADLNNQNFLIQSHQGGNTARFFCNDGAINSVANTDAKKHFSMSRNIAGLYYVYLNYSDTIIAQVSNGLSTMELYACGSYLTPVLGVPTVYPTNRIIRYVIVASYLTEDEIGIIIDLMEAYLTNYGTNLI